MIDEILGLKNIKFYFREILRFAVSEVIDEEMLDFRAVYNRVLNMQESRVKFLAQKVAKLVKIIKNSQISKSNFEKQAKNQISDLSVALKQAQFKR